MSHLHLHSRILRLVLSMTIIASASRLGAQSPTPPPTASAAVEQFFRAASDSNLTRMAQLFGTDKGSAQATGKPENYPKRMVIMQAMLRGTKVRALTEVATPRKHHKVVTTEIAKGDCKVVLAVTAVQADHGWLVREFDLPAVWDGVNRPCVAEVPGN